MAAAAIGRLLCAAGFAALVASSHAQGIVPETTPQLSIPGFAFPESEAAVTAAVAALAQPGMAAARAAAKIHLHGWGLWTALTLETAQSAAGQPLRVFETWQSTEDLSATPNPTTGSAAPARRRSPPRPLAQLRVRPEAPDAFQAALDLDPVNHVLGVVKFDPTAADHVVRQHLLSTTALDALLQGGAQQVPPFPATALVAKAVYQIAKAADLIDGRYYALKVWSGPPATPQPWAPSQWPGCVWIDVLDGGSGHGAIDMTAASDGSSRSDDTTYPLSGIIHYLLSAVEAADLNQATPGTQAAAGDIALMVAMHVAGRETARWTWQTFWWTPTPGDPHEPSSAAIASQRPAQLQGAPRNYAMAQAYSLFTPDQPYTGGENAGAPVYAYNPWVEARFGPTDLPDSQPLLDASGRPIANNVGVQTNCMSCHLRSNYNPNVRITAPRFAGLRYTDLNDAQFVGTLQVDFLWSIPRSARAAAVFPQHIPSLLLQ